MKILLTIIVVLAKAATSYAVHFQNFGFDDAVLTNSLGQVTPPGGSGLTQNMLPGWQLSINGSQVPFIGYNQDYLDTLPFITLLSPDKVASSGGSANIAVDGRFGLLIYEDVFRQDHFSLKQTGDVPANAKLLTVSYFGAGMNVEINGSIIGSAPAGGTVPMQTLTFDVSAYAGKSVTLSFDGTGDQIFHNGGAYFLDNISFQVPEPSTVALFVLGGGALLAAGFKWRRV